MEIKDRIKSLGKYFKTMQVASVDGQQVVYVVVEFPNGWSIGDDIEEKFKVTIANGENPNEYYFCGDIENGFESVFDAIEYNVDMMKEATPEMVQLVLGIARSDKSSFYAKLQAAELILNRSMGKPETYLKLESAEESQEEAAASLLALFEAVGEEDADAG